MACGQALGIMGGGNSLDNTLRIGNLVASDWVLLDIQISMVANGFGHGSVNMWAQDGTFLAVASQSVIVRYFERMRGAPPEPAT
jgi:acyl-CoA thioesterase